MARNVNVWMTNWHWTGNDVPVPQAEVDIVIQWTSDTGELREHSVTARFPNCLQEVPVSWVKAELEDLILRAVRKRLGVD